MQVMLATSANTCPGAGPWKENTNIKYFTVYEKVVLEECLAEHMDQLLRRDVIKSNTYLVSLTAHQEMNFAQPAVE